MDELLLETQTTAKLTLFEQEHFSQYEMNLRHLLSLTSDKTYTRKSLQNGNILRRTLSLLFHKRYDRDRHFMTIASHISYDKLFKVDIRQ